MRVLVIGGTGPTGPHLVNGLIARGHDVVILHGGFHEVEFVQPVEHIHTDPHFAETLGPALAGRTFDLVIATYGRIRVIADVLKGRTARLITVSGGAVYAPPEDPRWGPLGPPIAVAEDSPLHDETHGAQGLPLKIRKTERAVMAMHKAGHFSATVFRYPMIYGPHAPANPDWSIVRRILDGRRRFVVGDGGLTVLRRGFAANVAHALLLAVDKADVAAGRIYNVADDVQHSLRQRVDLIARALGHEWELVNVPQQLARKVSPLWVPQRHFAFDTTKLRTELGYADVVPTAQAIVQSAQWLCRHPPKAGGELEKQLGDPFAYDAEDRLMHLAIQSLTEASVVEFPDIGTAHMYRHPKKPDEDWTPSSNANASPPKEST